MNLIGIIMIIHGGSKIFNLIMNKNPNYVSTSIISFSIQLLIAVLIFISGIGILLKNKRGYVCGISIYLILLIYNIVYLVYRLFLLDFNLSFIGISCISTTILLLMIIFMYSRRKDYLQR